MIKPRWCGQPCIVAASGPSLNGEVAGQCLRARDSGFRIIAVSDAYRLLPFADILYAADIAWWRVHKGCPEFCGEKWTSYQQGQARDNVFSLNYVRVRLSGDFSTDPSELHGFYSGFQALNMALLMKAKPIILVGFNMKPVNGQRHFFGDHPKPLDNSANFEAWIPSLEEAVRKMPEDADVVNATPDSAVSCFRALRLEEALRQ